MLGDNQEQNTSNNSTAIQAGRDVHYHGMSVLEVKEFCNSIIKEAMPILREEARQVAQQYVREFSTKLEAALSNNLDSISLEKFGEPDVQAAINDAVNAALRKGDASNPDVLCMLITERVSINSSDYKNIVLTEAINVVPKLTSQQISLISFHHFITSVVFQNLPDISGLENPAKIALKFSEPGFNLSDSQMQHIQYAGACSINTILGGDAYESVRTGPYAYLKIDSLDKFKDELSKKAPTYQKLLQEFNDENLFRLNLTSVGQAIGIANMSPYFGKLDYGIWLK